MKRLVFISGVFLFLAAVIGCNLQYHELGDRTFVYYLNGEKHVGSVNFGGETGVRTFTGLYRLDSLRSLLIFDDDGGIMIDFYITDFHGAGLYDLQYGQLDSCQVHWQARAYDTPVGPTFLRVLEWDEETGFLSAVFEARLTDGTDRVEVTKGRWHGTIKIDEL
ncbi:MAG: hypothetical protein GXO27_01590 [Chlorobi bacterium]|nr:hypothetical protein [Chlorobiota bacterium]